MLRFACSRAQQLLQSSFSLRLPAPISWAGCKAYPVSRLIQVFLSRAPIATPTRYFTRWSRRVREFGFSPEDARMLALGSFCTNQDRDILGMRCFITYDHPLVNLWNQEHNAIERRLNAMRRQLTAPYNLVQLPSVQLLA